MNLHRPAQTLSRLLLVVGAATAAPEPMLTFDIHVVVLTGNPAAQQATTADQLRREVDILNEFFVTEARMPLVRFRFKSWTSFSELRRSHCGLKELADMEAPLDTALAAEFFNACNDPLVRDPRAINFYVYDAYAPGSGSRDATGHGRSNLDRPFVFLDWQRLNHGDQAAEEHEMGHAFGLEHRCAPGATRRTPTNIMTRADCGKGSGGRRNMGFDGQQAATILRYAQRIAARLH